MFRYLLQEASASVNITDEDGDTALHYAAFGRKPDVMEYLLCTSDPKADVNSTNAKKCSVLHVSVVMQDIKAVQLILRQPNISVNKFIVFGEIS